MLTLNLWSLGQVYMVLTSDIFPLQRNYRSTTADYVTAQHEHNSPHRSTTYDYIPAQQEHNSSHRSTTDDYIPAQHEHNSHHRSTAVNMFLLNKSIIVFIDR